MTAAGGVELGRRPMRRPGCGLTAHPADARVGIGGLLGPQATRLACPAAATWSFDVASDRLDGIAGLRIDDETIRRHCHEAAAGLIRHRDACPPRAAFAAARGDVESLTDGVSAPTRDGWVELKLARSQVRPRVRAAEVADRADRDPPAPSAGVAYATTADCRVSSGRWGSWAEGLGLEAAGPLTMPGDGAARIWSAATEHFPAAEQVLDIFHASQPIAAAAAGLHGEGTAAARGWLDGGRARPLADGRPGLLDPIGGSSGGDRTVAGQAVLGGMVGHFSEHTERVGQEDGTPPQGAGTGSVRRASGRDGGVDRQRGYARVGRTVGPAGGLERVRNSSRTEGQPYRASGS